MIILDTPPTLILPDHYQASRPAIIRPVGDLASYFPVELDRKQRRAIVAELVKLGAVDDRSKARRLVEAAIPFGMFAFPAIELNFVTSANGNSSTKNIPSAGVAAGDLCVFYDGAANGSGNPAAVNPAGWTTFCDVVGNTVRNCFHAKILTSGEIGGSITGLSGTFTSRYGVAVFHPSIPISSFTVNDPKTINSATDPASQTTASNTATSKPVLVLGMMQGAASFTPTETPAMTDITMSSVIQKGLYTIYNPSDTLNSQLLDMGDTGNFNAILLAYLTFTR